jgi:hypothetical protein
MIRDFLKTNLTLAMIAAVALVSGEVSKVSAQDKLPTAEEVIAKYVEVTGGIEKYKAIKSMHQVGTMGIPMAGINGTIEMKVVAPNKVAVMVELPGAGNESSGSDGETMWSESTMTGNRIVEGNEAEDMMIQADFRRMFDPASVYKSLENVGITEYDDQKCYELKVEKKSGGIQQEFYSVETGLQVGTKTTAESPMGAIKVEATVSEYKEVDGIKFPFKMAQKFENGMVMEVEFEKIKVNPEFEEGTFDLPKSIQKIVAKKKAKEAKKAEGDGK